MKTGLLSPLRVQRETKPGRFADGGGLYLQVRPIGTGLDDNGKPLVSKRWLFRYSFEGKAKMVSLGAFSGANSLATVRKRAEGLRALLDRGVDPQGHREAERERRRQQEARAMTFEQCAEQFMAARLASLRSEKTKRNWRDSLTAYVFPVIGKLSVASIDEPLVLKVLHQSVPALRTKTGDIIKPAGLLWNERPETAAKVRNRIELILDWARVNKYRTGENPARWRGNLDHALRKRSGPQAVQHYAALPYADAPAFLKALREREGAAALALEFLILTAARTGEVLGAKWSEIQEEQAVWIIPGERMKAGKEQRVPLSAAALRVLERAKPLRRGEYVFPSATAKRPLSNMALLTVLKRMGRTNITVHGWRSTFRDWAAEETHFPNEVVEMALAHTVANKVEAAYRRGDLFEKRKALMAAWAEHCLPSVAAQSAVPNLRVVA